MSEQIIIILIQVACFIPALVFHEFMHGFVAHKLGDPTAKQAGRLSLNPLHHIDPFGTVVLPILLALANMPVFGYAKPVPYNPSYFKDIRKGDLLVGLAGPAANFILALVGAGVVWLLWGPVNTSPSLINNQVFYYFYLAFLPNFVLINLVLMFFNLLPIPPLDGSSIFAFILPKKCLPTYYKIQQYAFPVFMVLVLLVPYVLNFNPIGVYLNVTAGALTNLLLPF